jgi:UDP-glucose 4-epimerase
MKRLFNSDIETNHGTRHARRRTKRFSREERAKSEDSADTGSPPTPGPTTKKFVDRDIVSETLEEYTSHNTQQLTIDEIIEKIKTTDYVQDLLPSITSAS